MIFIVFPPASGLASEKIKPSFYVVSEGKGAVVVVQADLVRDFSENPKSQLNLIYFCKLALNPAFYPGVDESSVERNRESRRVIAEAVSLEAERRSVLEVLEFLVKHSIGLGDDEPTRQHFERYAYLARLEAKFLRQAGRYTDASRILRAVPRASKHYADALFERALIAQSSGRGSEAEICVREILNEQIARKLA